MRRAQSGQPSWHNCLAKSSRRYLGRRRRTDRRGRLVRESAAGVGKAMDQLIPSQRLITTVEGDVAADVAAAEDSMEQCQHGTVGGEAAIDVAAAEEPMEQCLQPLRVPSDVVVGEAPAALRDEVIAASAHAFQESHARWEQFQDKIERRLHEQDDYKEDANLRWSS